MFYGEIRIKQGLSYISFCPLRILYNSKVILMATSLGTNAVVVTRAHCTYILFELAGYFIYFKGSKTSNRINKCETLICSNLGFVAKPIKDLHFH